MTLFSEGMCEALVFAPLQTSSLPPTTYPPLQANSCGDNTLFRLLCGRRRWHTVALLHNDVLQLCLIHPTLLGNWFFHLKFLMSWSTLNKIYTSTQHQSSKVNSLKCSQIISTGLWIDSLINSNIPRAGKDVCLWLLNHWWNWKHSYWGKHTLDLLHLSVVRSKW